MEGVFGAVFEGGVQEAAEGGKDPLGNFDRQGEGTEVAVELPPSCFSSFARL